MPRPTASAIAFDGRDLIGENNGFDVLLAGDVFYDHAFAERLVPWFSRLADNGITVFVGDPGRSYLPRERLTKLAEYQVPVTRALEDAEVKRTTVWRSGVAGPSFPLPLRLGPRTNPAASPSPGPAVAVWPERLPAPSTIGGRSREAGHGAEPLNYCGTGGANRTSHGGFVARLFRCGGYSLPFSFGLWALARAHVLVQHGTARRGGRGTAWTRPPGAATWSQPPEAPSPP